MNATARMVITKRNVQNTNKVIIIDEQPIFSLGLSSSLEAEQSVLLHSELCTADDMVEEIYSVQPDAIFIGCLGIRDLKSITAIISALLHRVVPIFVMMDERQYLVTGPHISNRATLMLRNTRPAKLKTDVLRVVERARKSLAYELTHGRNYRDMNPYLTPAEKQVIAEIMKGYSQNEVASRLNKSVKTVSNQKISAMKRLKLRNFQELFNFLKSPDGHHLLN